MLPISVKHRNTLSTILIVAGLLLFAWPAMIHLYGIYSQKRLEQEFDQETAIEQKKPATAVIPVAAASATTRASIPEAALPVPVVRHPVARATVHASSASTKTRAKKESPRRVALAPPHTHPAATTPQPLGVHTVRKGAPFARLRIPRIGIEAIVVEGVDRSDLRRGPGHIPGTGLPGENRNCAIAAHRARWFRHLPDVQNGDPVWLETPSAVYQYTVDSRRTVKPNRADLLNRGDNPELTLITCDAPTYDAPYRILVFCRLAGVHPR